jgi:hypothetical protein
MRVGSVGDGLMDYVIGTAMRASTQQVQAAVAAKVLKTSQQAQQSVLQLLEAATQSPAPPTDTLCAKISGCGRNLDVYA